MKNILNESGMGGTDLEYDLVINTDINHDQGWEPLLEAGFGAVRHISIDDTWSALRWRPEKHMKGKPDSKFNKKNIR
jgi:hypothetical protein